MSVLPLRNGRRLPYDVSGEDSEGRQETDSPQPTTPTPVRITATVIYEQNRHGALTVRDDDTAATYHIVRYADPEVENDAIELERQARVELSLSPVGCRANVWQAEHLAGVHPDRSEDDTE